MQTALQQWYAIDITINYDSQKDNCKKTVSDTLRTCLQNSRDQFAMSQGVVPFLYTVTITNVQKDHLLVTK